MRYIYGYMPLDRQIVTHAMSAPISDLDVFRGDYSALLDDLEKEPGHGLLYRTYDPMLFQAMPDEFAMDKVLVWSREQRRLIKAFEEIPGLAKKLEVMGPGEALADTDMADLWAQAPQQETDDNDDDTRNL